METEPKKLLVHAKDDGTETQVLTGDGTTELVGNTPPTSEGAEIAVSVAITTQSDLGAEEIIISGTEVGLDRLKQASVPRERAAQRLLNALHEHRGNWSGDVRNSAADTLMISFGSQSAWIQRCMGIEADVDQEEAIASVPYTGTGILALYGAALGALATYDPENLVLDAMEDDAENMLYATANYDRAAASILNAIDCAKPYELWSAP